MKVGLGIIVFFILSQMAVVIEAIDSWNHQIFLPSQMMAQYGRPGIPFIAHGGMWGDMFLLPLLLCFMLVYSGRWSVNGDWLLVVIGVAVAVGNQMLLNSSTRPDPLGSVDLRWSLAIAVHAVYMATYIAIIGHFYFNPVGVTPTAIVGVSILLAVHVAAGTHVLLGLLDLAYHWKWCPNPLDDEKLLPMNAAIWLVLSGLSWHAINEL